MAIGMLTLGFSSCKKDKEIDYTADSDVVKENSAADAAFSDVANIADEAYSGSLSSFRTLQNEKIMTTCATIQFDTTSSPKSFIIDFGTTNCLCKDGNYRRGKINVIYSGFYRDSASFHTITFDNYFVNENQVLGTKTVSNNGRNSAGNLNFTVTVNGSINWSTGYGGGTSTFISNRTRTWVGGESTLVWNDDIYLITGSASGTNRSGNTYTMNIVSPLKKVVGFRHFTSGTIEWTPQGKSARQIDYDYLNGSQDNLAKVTINGYSFIVTLR